MEKWNYQQPCDFITGQLSAYLGVGGGRNTTNKKMWLLVLVAEDNPRQKPCRMTREQEISWQTEKSHVYPNIQKVEEYLQFVQKMPFVITQEIEGKKQ